MPFIFFYFYTSLTALMYINIGIPDDLILEIRVIIIAQVLNILPFQLQHINI